MSQILEFSEDDNFKAVITVLNEIKENRLERKDKSS